MIALFLDRELNHSRKSPDSRKIRLAKYMAYTVCEFDFGKVDVTLKFEAQ